MSTRSILTNFQFFFIPSVTVHGINKHRKRVTENEKVKSKKAVYFYFKMMEYVIRGLLLLHGFLLGKRGISYIQTPRNEVFMDLLKEKGLQGPGLDIAVPFLGISYFSIGMFNLLASTVGQKI